MKKIFLSIMLSLSTLSLMAKNVEADHRRSPHHHEHVCVVPAYSPEEISEITVYLKKCSFDSDKLEAANLLVKLRPITVEGLETIAKMFSFDDKRSEFLIFAYDYCVDRESYFKLRSVFTFSNNAEKMYKTLGM